MFYVLKENGGVFYDLYYRIIVHDIESEAQYMADTLTQMLNQQCTVEWRQWRDSYSPEFIFDNYVLYKRGLNLYREYIN